MADGFYHQYSYDAENRITAVKTSRDSIQWETDATYTYYRHGPLARLELGSLKLQGVDYVYTLHGWLKSINPSWKAGFTPLGAAAQYDSDGMSTTAYFERDAYKLNLNYFDDGTYTDFRPIAPHAGYVQGNALPSGAKNNLYNGNIASMAVDIRALATTGAKDLGPMIYNYGYDQLNRISSMDAWAANDSLKPISISPLTDYKERYTYDPNGNILSLHRNGDSAHQALDSLTYNYLYAKTGGGTGEYIPGHAPTSGVDHLTNQLSSIGDSVKNSHYGGDLKSQSAFNYKYDEIGELISDDSGYISNAKWSVYGKLLSLTDSSSNTISFTYDASGNRISKVSQGITTWYVRDAQGNVMSVYTQNNGAIHGDSLTQTEVDLYGSSRLGVLNLSVNCAVPLTMPASGSWVRGTKLFELTNHLGNVLETISDKKIQHTSDSSTADYYVADAINASDYYPFGMQMPGRSVAASGYRYGFNGQEKSNELDPNGNLTTAAFWEYDGRNGRRWNLDPSPAGGISAYSTFMNNPNFFTDPRGDTSKFFGNDGSLLFQNNKGAGIDLHVVATAQFNSLNAKYKNKDKLTAELTKIGINAYEDQDAAAAAWAPGGFEATRGTAMVDGDNLERAARIFHSKAFGDPKVRNLYIVGSTVKGHKVADEPGVSQETDPTGSTIVLNGTDITKYQSDITVTTRSGGKIVNEKQITYFNWKVSALIHTHPRGSDNFSISNSSGSILEDTHYSGDYGLALDGISVYLVPTTTYPLYEMFRLDLLQSDKTNYFDNFKKGQDFMNDVKTTYFLQEGKVIQVFPPHLH